ncbi:MAG: succinylglutamate desuccinylase/aspartoacylase family protein [Steroidobacteraceae bacterium]|nr:succinylglutamate desuccinylase/aspartoacylase family protein [Steroidobacteraceae bacterium]
MTGMQKAAALVSLLPGCVLAAACARGGPPPQPGAVIATHADGRAPIGELYAAYESLVARGWSLDVVAESAPEGTTSSLPIIALRSPGKGPAVWILSGIHGEEPAGPNAIAAAMGEIAELGSRRPVVLLPLLNPHGYARNWRYLNVAVYSEAIDGHSVGDSSHLLDDPDAPGRPRASAPSSPEADAVTRYILAHAADYPPAVSIDLHEDNLIHEGYVYSQGAAGAADPLAVEAVAVLRNAGVPIKAGGTTRFDEPIADGIIGPVTDSSIDELMSTASVIADGQARPGPQARTVLVFETPAAALPLGQRIAAHAALLRRLAELLVPPAD